MSGVRTPRQQRALQSWTRVLDAGAELLAERGWAGVTLAEVTRRAGVSNGSIYWRVSSKEALLTAIHERLIDTLDAESAPFEDRAQWDALDADEAIARAVALQTSAVRRHRRLLRALVLHAATDPEAAKRGAAAVRRAARRFEAALAPLLEREGHPEPVAAARFVHELVFGALIKRITWPEQEVGRPLSWRAFEAELATAARAYLLAPDRRHSPDGHPG
jgi:AcrR family transcriptional regulator